MRTALLVAVLTGVPSVFAQNKPPACDGDITVVRVSTIRPGQLEGFMSAVAAHKAWYRSHGYKDNVIVASRIINRDEKTGAMKYSDAEVLTYHVRPPGGPAEPKHDAAWDAYVKQYRETSDIKNQYITCMPKLAP